MKFTFYRYAHTADGPVYKSPLMCITVAGSIYENSAKEHAIKAFETHMKVNNWYELAMCDELK